MKKLLVAVAAALVVPAAAQGKGLQSIAVCGPSECRDVAVSVGTDQEPFDASRDEAIPAVGPYYELRLTFEEGVQSRGIFYEPRSGLVSFAEDVDTSAWAPIAPRFAAAVEEASKHVDPFPAPKLEAVYVGDRRVTGDPTTYLELFRAGGPSAFPESPTQLEWIRFAWPETSPWDGTVLAYYPADGVLSLGGAYVELPQGVAADVAAARALRDGPAGAGRLPWIAIGTALAGLLFLLSIGFRRAPEREAASVH